MRTLNDVQDRCYIDDEGHWIWRGPAYQRPARISAPNFTTDPSGATMSTQNGKRATWHINTGKPIKPGHQVWSICDQPYCIAPSCLRCGSLETYGAWLRRTGKWKRQHNRILALRRNSDKRRKVTLPVAKLIRLSEQTNAALAEELGLHHYTVGRVRRGESKVPGNFFAGLMP